MPCFVAKKLGFYLRPTMRGQGIIRVVVVVVVLVFFVFFVKAPSFEAREAHRY